MPKSRHKPKGTRSSGTPSRDDIELERFFTNAEEQRQEFEGLVSSAKMSRRILIIHGIGGTGKSTLLKIYRLFCQRRHIPIALVGGEETTSLIGVLTEWVNDLKGYAIEFPSFQKMLARYNLVQAKVDAKAKTGIEASSTKVGKRTAQGALDAAAGAVIPVVGPIVSALAGAGVEASIDWLRGFLSQADLEIYLHPEKELVDNFLTDVNRIAAEQRIVLMLDTFEQLPSLGGWIGEIARSLDDNVLLVIAGRNVPEWERSWPGWMGKAVILEQREMNYDEVEQLIHRYYKVIRNGEPDDGQVKAIAKFARGLPMVATTVVQLWVKYRIEDFHAVKPQVVADLVDRLFEGVPKEMLPAFEAAAVVRYFSGDTLETLLDSTDVNTLYAELRRWPFIRVRREGLAVHDAMREMINEALRIRVPSQFQDLHSRAVMHYQSLLQKSKASQRMKLTLELLYHQFQLGGDEATQLFCSICEQLVNTYAITKLGEVIDDVKIYLWDDHVSKLWCDYYTARLLQLEGKTFEAEQLYEVLAAHSQTEPQLRAYVLCDLGRILSKWERLGREGGVQKAMSVLQTSIATVPPNVHTVESFFCLARVYEYQGNWQEAVSSLSSARLFFSEMGPNYGTVHIYNSLKASHVLRGEWKEMLAAHENGLAVISVLPDNPYLKSRLLGQWAWAWAMAGRYRESENNIRESLQILYSLGNDKESDPENVPFSLSTSLTVSDKVIERISDLPVRFRNLGLALGLQKKFAESERYFAESVRIPQRRGSDFQEDVSTSLAMWGIILVSQGAWSRARLTLTRSLAIKEEIKDILGIAENQNWLGLCYEILGDLKAAAELYERSLSWRYIGRRHIEVDALVSLCRLNYRQGNLSQVPALLIEARQIATEYEYNDHLAQLSLIEGYIATDGTSPDLRRGLDQALFCHQEALTYALRYNRFLLDDLLWSNVVQQYTPIIPYWLNQGKQGIEMLTALRDWWQRTANNIGIPRQDSISLVPTGMSLLEAEDIARKLEPGDGSQQHKLVEQINAALSTAPRG